MAVAGDLIPSGDTRGTIIFTATRLGNATGVGATFVGATVVITLDLGSVFSANFTLMQWNGIGWVTKYSWVHPAGGSGSYTVTERSDGSYPEWFLDHTSGAGDPTVSVTKYSHGNSGGLVYYFNGSFAFNLGLYPIRIDSGYKTNRGAVITAANDYQLVN